LLFANKAALSCLPAFTYVHGYPADSKLILSEGKANVHEWQQQSWTRAMWKRASHTTKANTPAVNGEEKTDHQNKNAAFMKLPT